MPVLVIGRGSNLLIADAGFDGVAIVARRRLRTHRPRPRRDGRVDAGGAVPLPVLARQAAKAGVAGLEFYVGIPGASGGAVRMNAGGHGARDRRTSSSRRGCSTCATRSCARSTPPVSASATASSALGPGDVVLSARFAGQPDDPAACERRIDEIVRWRREHQPGGQNAGSVFTNPPGDSAGPAHRRVRAARACGSAGVVVSEKHANFFVAVARRPCRATCSRSIRLVQERVESETGVRLVPELQLVGFAGSSEEAAG